MVTARSADRGLQTGITMLSGVTAGWGVGLEDFDNDGRKDLFVAQGHVLDNVEKIDPSLHYLEPTLLALNRGGRFEPADPGTHALVAARGTAFGDLNNDGSIDVVTTVLGGPLQVFMNRGGQRPLAHDYSSRHAQQPRRPRSPRAGEWTNSFCHDCGKL